ncbi:T9SS type A sorting domain-containing protein [Psychroserpens sp. MEBiC05023]
MKRITNYIVYLLFTAVCSINIIFAQLPEGSHLLVSDITAQVTPTSDYKILKFDHNGENGVLFTDEELSWPQDILIANLPNEGYRVLISNFFSGKITKYDLDGNYIDDFATGIGAPTRMRILDNILYVLQWNNQNGPEFVLQYNLDGSLLGNYTSAGIFLSIGMDWDSDGDFYISAFGSGRVYKFNSSGQYDSIFINESNLSGPTNIWFDKTENGNMWVIDYGDSSLKLFNSLGEPLGTIVSGLSTPEGVAFLDNGNFLIGNGPTGLIKMYDSNGTFIEDFIDSDASMAANLINTNAFYIMPSTLSTTDINQPETAFISPSLGREFKFDSKLVKPSDDIHVYSILGKHIETLTLKDNLSWTPKNYSDGVYIVHISSYGKERSQKIIIKN